MLKDEGFYVAMETNGTGHVPENVDWVTLSPKSCFVSHAPALVTMKVNEVKVVFDGIHDPMPYGQLGEGLYLNLQPCDTGDEHKNREVTRQCVEYIKQHPQWHLSLQTHKLISIP
jgi:organic radical activating enzyme